nr:hypothetical protein [Tanacetum cinerariifolium]
MLQVREVDIEEEVQILKLKARVKKLERLNKVKSSKLRRLKRVGTSQRIELVDDQEKDAQVKGIQADTQAETYNIDLDHTSKVLSMQEDSEVQEVVKVVNAAKLMTEPMKKKDQIAMDVEDARKLQEEEESHAQAKDAAKRRRLREQAKEDENLKKQLEVVANEDDDVFVEATPIGTKVPVVNYE